MLGKLTRGAGLSRLLGFVLLLGFIGFRYWDPPPLEAFRLKVFDFYQIFKPRVSPPQPVVIADIDDESLKSLGQWPWPRTMIADLVTRITQSGGVAIAFDIVFAEPDRLSPNLVADTLKSIDEETRTRLRQAPSNDLILSLAMRKSLVVVGQSGFHRVLEATEKLKPQSSLAMKKLHKDAVEPKHYLLKYPGLLVNVPELESTAKGHGVFSVQPDYDGIVRRVPIAIVAQNRVLPAITTELLRVATGKDAILLKSDQRGISSIVVANVEIPTDSRGQLLIYFNKHDAKRFISVKDILTGPMPVPGLAGKLVLVGTSAVGLHDLKATPVSPAMPGVEVHAQVLENILTKSYLRRPGWLLGAEIAVAFFMGISIILLAPALGPLPVLGLGSLIAATLMGLSWYQFAKNSMLVDVAYPLVSSFAIFLVLTFMNYFREEAQRKQVRSAFGQYISPDLVEQLAEDPDKLVLGGETKDMTILFSDVRGFTSISELYKTDPQGLTRLMNRFLTPLSDAIMERKGTIDKYMGDCIMAFWNAPINDPDHAVNATVSGLEMLERLETVNVERRREAEESGQKYVPLNVGVGINTGECVVGNMGSETRFDYSVLGDCVNLASRLEGQTKTYGVNLMVGSATAALIKHKFKLLELDTIRVKGKEDPEKIFATMGSLEDGEKPEIREYAETHEKMLACYLNQDWDGVEANLALLEPNAESVGFKGLHDLYKERLALFRETPPPADWDGVWTMDTK